MRRFAICALALAIIGAPASAQYYGFGFPSPNLNIITNSVGNQAFTQSVVGNRADDEPDQETRIPANPAALRYTPSLPQRQRNLAGMVTSAEREQPGAGSSLQGFLSAGDPVAITSGIIAPLGLKTDNLADALTFYLLSHWMVVNRQSGWPGRSQVLGLRGQVERGLLASGQFQSAPNAEKQKTAESMMISGLLAIGAYAGAEGNAEATANVAAYAAQNVKGMGLDLAALELGPNGFEKVK
jgi:hypothetical protein